LIAGDAVVAVEIDMVGRILRSNTTGANADRQHYSDVEDDDSPPVDDGCRVCGVDSDSSDDDDMDPRVLAPIGVDDVPSDDGPAPLHTRRDIIPIFDINRTVPSHLIWNSQYGVMRRGERYANVRSNAILEHIVASTNSASVSLLYPEGQLFPRIFWYAKSGSVAGAIPSFMLNTSINCALGLASVSQHQYVRMRDGDILTSRESPYWHFLFEVALNTSLNKVPSKLVYNRGLEILENDGKKSFCESAVDTRLPMCEGEATRRIKELSCLLKKGQWTYFLTLTVNDKETPGVREITEAIRDYAIAQDSVFADEVESDLTDNFLPFILRAWERFVRFFLQELIMKNDTIIGKVKNIFYRFEFQGAGAKGTLRYNLA